jgi:hypothetical protein
MVWLRIAEGTRLSRPKIGMGLSKWDAPGENVDQAWVLVLEAKQ